MLVEDHGNWYRYARLLTLFSFAFLNTFFYLLLLFLLFYGVGEVVVLTVCVTQTYTHLIAN